MDYWAQGFIVPSVAEAKGTGSERRYSFADLIALRTARILRDAGLSTEALKPAMQAIKAGAGWVHAKREWLLVNGVGVCHAYSAREIVAAIAESEHVIVVDLARIESQVKEITEG